LEIANNLEKSRYEIFIEGKLAGFADYKILGETVKFPHTEVDPAFGGRGVGSSLVEFALDDVKKQHKLVAPICPFVAKAISKKPDQYLELVPETERAKYGIA
jgi:predicted GNAT family acetyltransferase